MNRIDAEMRTSPYGVEFLALLIDGLQLDELLHEVEPERKIRGLIPAFYVEYNPPDIAVVRARLLPTEPGIFRTPVLICPDDLDFTCSVVIADMKVDGERVAWSQFGMDCSAWSTDPEHIGATVTWFDASPSFVFERRVYWSVLNECFAKVL